MSEPIRRAYPDAEAAEPSLAQRVRWSVTRGVLRPLVRWRPLRAPRLGYSVLIGATRALAPLIDLHLRLIDAQDKTGLDEILIVLDCPLSRAGEVMARCRERYGHLPVRFIGYSAIQHRVLHGIGWSKCFSWASWCIGLAAAESRHVLIHDFDAFVLDRGFLRRRHRMIRQRAMTFLGVERYRHPPIREEDGLVGTWEMMLDAAWVRRHAQPIDVFNCRRELHGRMVDLDTFHGVQARSETVCEPEPEGVLVHATQMICQSGQLLRAKGAYEAPANMTTPLIPYLFEAAGIEGAMERATIGDGCVRILGRDAGLSAMTRDRVHGLRSMAESIDRVLRGGLRPEAEAYFGRLDAVAEQNERAGVTVRRAA